MGLVAAGVAAGAVVGVGVEGGVVASAGVAVEGVGVAAVGVAAVGVAVEGVVVGLEAGGSVGSGVATAVEAGSGGVGVARWLPSVPSRSCDAGATAGGGSSFEPPAVHPASTATQKAARSKDVTVAGTSIFPARC